jgi:hypothetical protein
MLETSAVSLNRRTFLRTTSGVVVFFSLGARELIASPVPDAPLVASVGFWGGVPAAARRYSLGRAATLTSSADLTSGDPRLLRTGVRIGVRSFFRAESRRTSPASFALDVLYQTEAGAIPFYAWSFRHDGGTASRVAQRSSFTAAVDALTTLDLVVRSADKEQTISFSSNTGTGVPLRPGVYAIAFHEGSAEPIDWSAVSVRDGVAVGGAHPEGVLAVRRFGEELPAPFSYLILCVDPA